MTSTLAHREALSLRARSESPISADLLDEALHHCPDALAHNGALTRAQARRTAYRALDLIQSDGEQGRRGEAALGTLLTRRLLHADTLRRLLAVAWDRPAPASLHASGALLADPRLPLDALEPTLQRVLLGDLSAHGRLVEQALTHPRASAVRLARLFRIGLSPSVAACVATLAANAGASGRRVRLAAVLVTLLDQQWRDLPRLRILARDPGFWL